MKALEEFPEVDEITQQFGVAPDRVAVIGELADDRLLRRDASLAPADPGFEPVTALTMGCHSVVLSGHWPWKGASCRWFLGGAIGGDTIRDGATNIPTHSPLPIPKFAGKVGERSANSTCVVYNCWMFPNNL